MRADRVNLFPLAYHQGDNTSLLWPIIDADPHGFAIRPLLNVEKDDIAVLFPLSSVNTKRKAGWLLTAYRNEDAFGLFPLMHISDDFHWIIPWWNVRDEEGWGLLPLYGDYGDGLKNISLAWWDRDTNKKLQRFGVFPLYYQRADNSESWLWPIYGRHVNENGNYNGWAASGLAHWDGNDKGRRARWLHPLYYDVTDGEDRTFAILPLWGMFKDASSSFWITPLGGYGQTDKGQITRSILGPLYVDTHGPDGNQVWPALIGHWRGQTDKHGNAWRVWPFVSHWDQARAPDFLYHCTLAGWNTDKQSTHGHVTPLIAWDKNNSRSSWRAWPLAAGSKSDQHSKFSLGSSLLYNYSRSSPRGGTVTKKHNVPIIFSSRKSVEQHKLRVLLGTVAFDRDGEDRTSFRVLRYLYRRERSGEDVRRDFFPFFQWDSRPNGGHISFLWRVWNSERNDDGKRHGHFLFVPWGDES